VQGVKELAMIHIRDFTGKHVHFIGIGGISMSGLAEILLERGYRVSGSDLRQSGLTARLERKGAAIYQGHNAQNIREADLIVYTAAVKDDNPELMEAKKQNIPYMSRATLLGQIMETYRFSIGVAGAHGKTTTTSMLSIMMNHAGLDPTILIGGELDEIGGNVQIGQSEYFVTEACEYMDSFLKFHPYMAVILNIDKDHLDYFKDMNQIYSSFVNFANLVPKSGYVIGCGDDPLVARLMEEVSCSTISYGIHHPCNWLAHDIVYDKEGHSSFLVENNGRNLGQYTLKVPGKHNIYNALASIAACDIMGIPSDSMQEALLHYGGTHRRFEVKGKTYNQAVIIDDYAHHPTEIKATIRAALNYPHNRIWCIFQPHTYTRTKKLFQDFTEAFHGVDFLILADIYAAREKNTGDISSEMLAEAIAQKDLNCTYIPGFSLITDYVREHAKPGDLIITMGAGNIYEIGNALLQ
jgi:UDP-N-acetylmuramate--alanine ligase